MHGRLLLSFCLGLGLAAWCWGGSDARPFITAYSALTLDPGTAVWTATQGPGGRMYFGADSVLEFDGTRWRSLAAGNAKFVRALAFDADGRLWVGAYDEIGYFEPAHGSLGSYVSLTPLLPERHRNLGTVWQVFPQRGGAVFVTQTAALRWNGLSIEAWEFPNPRRLIGCRIGERIYFGGRGLGLMVLQEHGPEIVIPGSALGDDGMMWMERQGDGLLLATGRSLYSYQNGRLDPFAPAVASTLPKNVLTSVVRLPDGNLALGTYHAGIMLLNPAGALIRTLGPGDGLPSRMVYSLFVDRDGNLWATNQLHVYRLDLSAHATLFDHHSGLPGKDAMGFARLGETLVMATADGLFATGSADRPQVFASFSASAPSRSYLDLLATPFGLLGGRIGGIDLMTAGTSTEIYRTSRDVFELIASRREPEGWYARAGDDLHWLRRNAAGSYDAAPIASLERAIRGMSEAPDGALWFGSHLRGATILRRGTVEAGGPTMKRAVAGLPPDAGATLTARVGDRMVVLTQRGAFAAPGLDATVQPVPELAEVRCLAVTKSVDGDQAWVVGTRRDAEESAPPFVVRLTPGGRGAIRADRFEIDGIARIGGVRTIYRDGVPPAALWIGGTEGLLKVDLGRLAAPAAPRAPLLTAVQARPDRGPALSFVKEIPFAANRLAFAFSSTEYARVDSLRFETKLVGVDRDWAATINAAPREYLGLREGDYRFQVRTVSPSGLRSASAEWAFTVRPPWYRTVPAYFGYVLLAGLVLVGGVQFRLRAIRRRNRELERLVRERTAELEQANAAKTQFVARINHDIRNPIHGVLGLSLALADTTLSPRQRKLTASLQQCARFLASLVDEVLDFAQLESSRDAPLKAEPFDLAGALTAAQATAQAQANEFGCRIAVDLDPKLPARVVGDAVRLQRILVNFLGNAVKYGGGPTVELAARVQQHSDERVVVRISVRDFGPGIGDEEQKQLFNQFFRGRHARERKIQGSGLGLAVCRLLAESMGGTVGVESALGHGSLFSVTVPFALDRAPSAAAGDRPHVPIRVLVVEDEEYNAVATGAILRRLGCTVTLAYDGREALALLRAHRFDVVFLDWDLPFFNGGEVARQYRRDEPAGRHTLIIATTAFATEDQRQACIAKPLTPERILETLRGTSDARRPAPAVEAEAPAPVTPPPAEREFDLSLLQSLSDGSPAENARLLRDYLEAGAADLRRARQAVETGDCAAVRTMAHRLVSHARFIGAERFADRLIALQDAALVADRELLPELVAATEAEFHRLRDKLAAIPASSEPGSPPTRAQNG
jgi:signal transduction histidine kinase/CheY-like chemotaxis protein